MPFDGVSDPNLYAINPRRLLLQRMTALGGLTASASLSRASSKSPRNDGTDLALDLAVSSTGTRQLSSAFLGFNGNLVGLQEPWRDERLLEVFSRLNAGNIRYPGGTVANFWDWDDGAIDRRLSASQLGGSRGLLANKSPATSYRLDNLAILVRASGVKPIFVANMVRYGVDEQIAHLNRAKSLGIPIELVELGNEFYIGRGAYPAVDEKFPNVDKYADDVALWSRRLKSAFPGIRIAAIATGPMIGLKKSLRRRSWDENLFRKLENVDALTIHTYARAPAGEQNGEDGDAGSAWGSAEAQVRQYQSLKSDLGAQLLFSRPRERVRGRIPVNYFPPGLDLWVTEFSLIDAVGALRGTWAHGLGVAGFVDSFLLDERIKYVCYHNLFAQAMFSAIWRNPDELRFRRVGAFRHPAAKMLTGPGVVLKMFLVAMHGMTSASPVVFLQPNSSDRSVVDREQISCWLFSNQKVQRALIVNFSGRTLRLQSFPGRFPEFARKASFSAALGEVMSVDPDEVIEWVSSDRRISPWSVTILE